jgi:23S rRNA (uridine2552-2'-O)-methyltransferase
MEEREDFSLSRLKPSVNRATTVDMIPSCTVSFQLLMKLMRSKSPRTFPPHTSSASFSSSSKSSKSWLSRHTNDFYVKQSAKQNLRSRAVFKLEEIQSKHHFISPSSLVLDLGAAPGGWSLALSKIIQPSSGGAVYAVDLLPFPEIPNVHSLQGDFLSVPLRNQLRFCLEGRPFDVIVSDMLQNTSGDKDRDHFLSMELTHSILDFCSSSGTGAEAGEEGRGGMLKRNGSVLMKYLRGSDEKELTLRIQEMFQEHRIVKPKASRQESREVYLLCLKMR